MQTRIGVGKWQPIGAAWIAFVPLILAALLVPAHAIGTCHGGDRAARKVTCIVDGDTGWEHGVKWRYKAIDAPEMRAHAQCQDEAILAKNARDRLIQLMSGGYRINSSGDHGRFGRALVTITLANGRDAGDVLMGEGLAQPWPNSGNPWCD